MPRPGSRVTASGFFALRTPVLPFDTLEALGSGLEAAAVAGGDGPRLEAALEADRNRLRERIGCLLARPAVREALFLASPSLDEALPSWRSEPDGEKGRKTERALVRYLYRMAGRATPFGLFAGCAVGELKGPTRLRVESGPMLRRTRLDMDYLWSLARALARDPALRDSLELVPNTSLYERADGLRYLEGSDATDGRRYRLVALERTEALDRVLGLAHAGATRRDLAASLIDDEVDVEEAAGFIDELVEAQVLVSEIELATTGELPLDAIEASVARRAGGGSPAELLRRIARGLDALDRDGIGRPVAHYHAIARDLEALPADVEIARLFQVDLATCARGALGEPVISEIERAIDLFGRIAPARRDETLTRFVARFEERYEGREVPLLEALDEADGIGVSPGSEPSPLLHGFPDRTPERVRVEWGEREQCLLDLLSRALASGRDEIRLDDASIERLTVEDRAPPPEALAVVATLAAESPSELAEGRFRMLVESVDGPSGARLLGRFCHGDPRLTESVRAHLRAEEALHPDRVYAEIAHLPEGRTGNILLRPLLREYEIPWLGRSGAPADRRIAPSDLLVSVVDGEIVLRSCRLRRRVVPRLTSAHDHRHGIGVYRFLCALEGQGVRAGPMWDWGPLDAAPFLPRVVSGRLVLSRARWTIRRDELEGLGAGDARGFRAMQALRAARGLPRWIALVDGDNVLPVDFDNALAFASLAHLVRDRDVVAFQELYPPPGSMPAVGTAGRFVHQLIVPFVRVSHPAENGVGSESRTAPRPRPDAHAPRIGRSFPPGSEWLYVKLYGGSSTIDAVLLRVILPFARRTVEDRRVDRWFFLRYQDPDFHARIRFHGPDALPGGDLFGELRAALEPCVADGLVRRIALDTYEREIERYGGPEGMEPSEHLFFADSEAVLCALDRIPRGDAGLDERWKLALMGCDRLLDDFAIDLADRIRLLEDARDLRARLLRIAPGFGRALGRRYRALRGELETVLRVAPGDDHPLSHAADHFRRRSCLAAPALARLTSLDRDGSLQSPLRTIVSSCLHMHANRVFRAAANEHEVALYDLLARAYRAHLHRTTS